MASNNAMSSKQALRDNYPAVNSVDSLKLAIANFVVKCSPTRSSNHVDREWRNFVVEMVTSATRKLVRQAEAADTEERHEAIVRKTNAFVTSVDNCVTNGTFSDVMNAPTTRTGKWIADADKIFQLEDEAHYLQTAFDIPPNSDRNTHRSSSAPPMLFTRQTLAALIDYKIQPGILGPWIRVPELRKWLNTCDSKHGHHCGMSPQSRALFKSYPRWLVDVKRDCLVRAEHGQRYVVLSYVWGSGASFKTTKRNIDALQRHGSLSVANIGTLSLSQDTETVPIAKTVRDVIELTSLLDETYLWVDSLCIVQDDESDKHEQLSCMGSIYANAYVTIVAACGTASTGLRGIEGVTKPISSREYHRPEWWMQADKLRSRIQKHHRRLLASEWNQRAWTFQEQIFSRRLLVLDDISASWECHCHVWFEGIDNLDGCCEDNREMVAQGFAFESPAKFRDYVNHVIPYNKRLLTYPDDVLRAFSGIMGTLVSVFNGGFLCGLPVMFFDLGLLWFNDLPLKERNSNEATGKSGIPPSWSWAAWEGKLSFQELHSTKHAIHSAVKWEYGTQGDSEWKLVCNGAAQQPAGSGTSESETGTNAAADLSLSDAQLSSMLTYYLLSAKVERVVFKAVEAIDKISVPLLGNSGECVGVVTSCRGIYNKNHESFLCEVVAVSETCIDGSEVYKNVLWIEWKKGIAYRKGVGMIMKELWILESPEMIDLILG